MAIVIPNNHMFESTYNDIIFAHSTQFYALKMKIALKMTSISTSYDHFKFQKWGMALGFVEQMKITIIKQKNWPKNFFHYLDN
jgi:hypothetical protein